MWSCIDIGCKKLGLQLPDGHRVDPPIHHGGSKKWKIDPHFITNFTIQLYQTMKIIPHISSIMCQYKINDVSFERNTWMLRIIVDLVHIVDSSHVTRMAHWDWLVCIVYKTNTMCSGVLTWGNADSLIFCIFSLYFILFYFFSTGCVASL